MAMTIHFDILVTLCSLLIAALSLVFGYTRNRKEDTRREQQLSDSLGNISTMVGEIKDDIKKLDGRLDDHSIAIAEIREKIKTLFQQMQDLKERVDKFER